MLVEVSSVLNVAIRKDLILEENGIMLRLEVKRIVETFLDVDLVGADNLNSCIYCGHFIEINKDI